MEKIRVKVKKLSEDAIIPTYATEGSAGVDLHSIDEGYLLPNERAIIRTGIAVGLPDGYEMQIRPRSGLAVNHGITVLNTPGTVDSDFRGEVCVILFNTGRDLFVINKGDRIAQAVFKKVEKPLFIVTNTLDETSRGEGGFGSTGVGVNG